MIACQYNSAAGTVALVARAQLIVQLRQSHVQLRQSLLRHNLGPLCRPKAALLGAFIRVSFPRLMRVQVDLSDRYFQLDVSPPTIRTPTCR